MHIHRADSSRISCTNRNIFEVLLRFLIWFRALHWAGCTLQLFVVGLRFAFSKLSQYRIHKKSAR